MEEEGGSALRGDIPWKCNHGRALPVFAPSPPRHSLSYTPELSPARSRLRTRSWGSRLEKVPDPALQGPPGEAQEWARKSMRTVTGFLRQRKARGGEPGRGDGGCAGVRPRRHEAGGGHGAQVSGRADEDFKVSVVNTPRACGQGWARLDS